MSAHRLRLSACVTSLFVALVLTPVTSVAAQPIEADTHTRVRDAYDEAIDSALHELAYMQMSRAFGANVPTAIEQLPAELSIADRQPGQVMDGLAITNSQRGPAALEELERLGQVLSPPVVAVLSSAPVASLIDVAYVPYVRAHRDLVVSRLRLDGRDLSGAPDPTGLLGVFDALPGEGEVLGDVVLRAADIEQPIDRGDPPDVLIQGDGIEPDVVVEVEPAPTAAGGSVLSLDPVEMLIIAAVAVIVLGLVTLLVTSGQRYGRHPIHGIRSNHQFMEASRAIHKVHSVEQLCEAAVLHARLLTGSASAMITIDGFEAVDGPSFEVPVELVFDANRKERLVSSGSLHATPINDGEGTIIGLLVINGGEISALEAFEPLVEDGYTSVSSRAETAALAFVDGLTGIANRRRFDNDLDSIVGDATATSTPVAAAMFDVDNFKTFNDANGHQAGDEVLRQVAELISINLRSTDIVYRYGGEEFVALLPGATANDAFEVVERIRQVVEQASFEGESCQPGGTVTLSVGIAAAPEGDGRSLVRAADMALYEAKTTGRNRVVVEAHLS